MGGVFKLQHSSTAGKDRRPPRKSSNAAGFEGASISATTPVARPPNRSS